MKEPRSHAYFYRGMFVLLFLSAGLSIYNLIDAESVVWTTYSHVYVVSVLVYLWLVFIMLFWQELKQKFSKQFPEYDGERITVIMPCFNENPVLLTRAVRSVYNAKGNKDIIIVDDGSMNGVHRTLQKLERKEGITVKYLLINEGKRQALYRAVKSLSPKTQFVVTIDSDTILHEDALIKIVEPLKLPKIGAVSGDVQLLNEKHNLLTKMIGAYYWKALNIHRKSQSSAGIVSCCSGCLAAYKKDLLVEIIDDFASQTFLGERCTYSEDRHLTNLVLKKGYNVVYRPEAISYTYSPDTTRAFLRQQLRWRRGFIVEATYALTFTWRKKPLLFLQLAVWDLALPFLSFSLLLSSVVVMVSNPLFFIVYVLPAWIVFSIARSMPLVFHARDKIFGMLLFVGFYEFVLYWQSIYALFTVRNKSWITRG